MSNFFKELAKCESTILAEDNTAFSNGTRAVLIEFINCVKSGALCSKSESERFICKYYNQKSSTLTYYWRMEGHGDKSSNTFRCQIHNLSKKMYELFGGSVFDYFYSQDKEQLRQLRVKMQVLFFKDVSFSNIFFYEIANFCKDANETEIQNIKVQDCIDEIKLLSQLKADRFKSVLATKDKGKLSYIKGVLDSPLVDAGTKEVNEEKLKLLYALGVISVSA